MREMIVMDHASFWFRMHLSSQRVYGKTTSVSIIMKYYRLYQDAIDRENQPIKVTRNQSTSLPDED